MMHRKDKLWRNFLFFILNFFVPSFLFLLLCPVTFAADATLYVSPITGTYTTGTTFPLRVMVSSAGDLVNAVEGKLTYNPVEIEVVDTTHDGSVLNSWTVLPTFDNDEGTLSFGGLLSTSTVLDRGLILSFTVRAKRSGDMRIHFATGAAVHAADGTGGNLLSKLNGGIYAIVPTEGIFASSTEVMFSEAINLSGVSGATSSEVVSGEVLGAATGTVITSSTHPDQLLWYALATSTINWVVSEDLIRVRLALDKKPEGEGIVPYDVPKHEKLLTGLEDGIWFVHATREFLDGHSDTSVYQLNIDTTPPTNVSIAEKSRESDSDPHLTFVVNATDTVSGIEHYVFTLDSESPVTWVDDGTHEYHPHAFSVGKHDVVVSAVDRAGNKTDAHTLFSVEYLPTPTLVVGEKKFTEGDHLIVSLSGLPNAVISISMQNSGQGVTQDFTLDANGRGEFISKLALLSGSYEVFGIARTTSGAVSRETTHVDVPIRPSFLGVVKRHPLIPIVVVLFAVFLFIMRLFFKKIRGEGSGEESDDEEHDDALEGDISSPRLHRTPPPQSDVVVLSARKESTVSHRGTITITR